jgi:hypothetical protein
MRVLSSGDTASGELIVRDTVAVETPATFATWRSPTGFSRPGKDACAPSSG